MFAPSPDPATDSPTLSSTSVHARMTLLAIGSSCEMDVVQPVRYNPIFTSLVVQRISAHFDLYAQLTTFKRIRHAAFHALAVSQFCDRQQYVVHWRQRCHGDTTTDRRRPAAEAP